MFFIKSIIIVVGKIRVTRCTCLIFVITLVGSAKVELSTGNVTYVDIFLIFVFKVDAVKIGMMTTTNEFGPDSGGRVKVSVL